MATEDVLSLVHESVMCREDTLDAGERTVTAEVRVTFQSDGKTYEAFRVIKMRLRPEKR